MTSQSPVRANRGASIARLCGRSLFFSALIMGSVAFAVIAALPGALVAQTSTQSQHAPPPAYIPPPAGANLDAIGAKRLPNGPGKEIVETSCKDCHTFDRITMTRHSLTRWRTIVRDMQQRGANVDPGDVGPLVQYLAKNFGLRHTAAKTPSPAPSHPPSQ